LRIWSVQWERVRHTPLGEVGFGEVVNPDVEPSLCFPSIGRLVDLGERLLEPPGDPHVGLDGEQAVEVGLLT
jgi:hypothetical protein